MVDAVTDDLRNSVFAGTIAADSVLTELGLASLYDIARPTAKAAIERLVGEGLLVRNPNRSARVVRMALEDIRDVYYARLVIETEVMHKLSARKFVPPDALDANSHVRDIGDVSSIATVEPDITFHLSLVRALGSPRIDSMYEGLMGGVRLCMTQVQAFGLLEASEIAAEHDRIIDCIRAGDAAGASLELDHHLARARDYLVSSVTS
jgi:DNA-binding GntR family transcriptional regulator